MLFQLRQVHDRGPVLSPRTIWSDFNRRADWIPKLYSMKDAELKVREMAAYLEKSLERAYRLMLIARNEGNQIGAQRNVAMLIEKLHDLYEAHGVTPSVYTEFLEELAKVEERLNLEET
jgi:hypothetical protein